MKKILILALLFSALLTSCGSGWSCKKSYVKAKPHVTNPMVKEV